MFDKLIDLIIEFLGLFQFWAVVDTYEKGVVLRLGKYNRILNQGFHFIMPFYIEVVLIDNQTLETKNEINIVVSTNVLWEIKDIRIFLTKIEDAESIIEGVVFGEIAELITHTNYVDIMTEKSMNILLANCRIKCRVFGVSINSLTFRDFAEIKTIRIIGDTAVIPDDE